MALVMTIQNTRSIQVGSLADRKSLADQGYAVLRPNYRGSALGERFLTAGFGEWGRKMQTDLSDGVRFLVKEGIADPGRVCVVGVVEQDAANAMLR